MSALLEAREPSVRYVEAVPPPLVRQFELPVKVGVHLPDPDAEGGERKAQRDEYYVPGSLLAIEVDTAHPTARGASRELSAMVNGNSTVLAVTDPKAPIEVVARYRDAAPRGPLLDPAAPAAPVIRTAPAGIVARAGDTVTFSVEAEGAGDGAGHLCHLDGVGEARAVVIALVIDENLRLVLQETEGLGMDDPVPVPREGGAEVRLPLGVGAPPCLLGKRGESCREPLHGRIR